MDSARSGTSSAGMRTPIQIPLSGVEPVRVRPDDRHREAQAAPPSTAGRRDVQVGAEGLPRQSEDADDGHPIGAQVLDDTCTSSGAERRARAQLLGPLEMEPARPSGTQTISSYRWQCQGALPGGMKPAKSVARVEPECGPKRIWKERAPDARSAPASSSRVVSSRRPIGACRSALGATVVRRAASPSPASSSPCSPPRGRRLRRRARGLTRGRRA